MYGGGAVILLGRTNMFHFNDPKEAAKLREKRKMRLNQCLSGLLSSFSLSMTDLSKSCENLSAVMLYNPGLEFERQQREELEKLKSKRKTKKGKNEQYLKLELEKRRLEEQEREQVMLVAHLEEQLREKQVMIELLKRGDVQRVGEERRDLGEIRESLLKVKEA
ncbi:hypothetical protein DUI87_34093 [Hirundo rustica rustica]|uniref:Uncharacterized protein n=1 Tax=Hirundo rustica rustica TaxID=333673 RepID=A0A3M0ISQ0_HIRRU|nr:hypothetical protein DUI87_34093 [Hirundo rustica rustica]